LHVRKLPSQSISVLVFQAGYASSILVTRSTAKGLVSSLLNMPKLFEHQHNKNDRAGYMYSMIIGPRIGLAEVDHARCRAQFVPNIFMSFSCKDLAQSPLPACQQ
jgi:hypothetical protein